MAEVFKEGVVRENKVDDVTWSPRVPPQWDQMAATFTMLSEPLIGPERTPEAVSFVARLEHQTAMRPLMRLLEPVN